MPILTREKKRQAAQEWARRNIATIVAKAKARRQVDEEYRERCLAAARAWKARNKERLKAKRAEYYAKHKTEEALAAKAWRSDPCNNFKQRKRDYDKRYRQTHKQQLVEWQRANKAKRNQQFRLRYKTDIQLVLKYRLRARLTQALKRAKTGKVSNTLALVGCSINLLIGHLEAQFLPGMTWENRQEWHIDHIKPCSKFDLTDPEQQRQCFHYTNLQPLWKLDNIRKSNHS